MSDDEYNSDINSGSEDSDNEIVIPSTKKPLFKPSINIKSYTKIYNDIDDSEPDDAEPEEDEEENIVGGADEIVSEDEASEEGDVKETYDIYHNIIVSYGFFVTPKYIVRDYIEQHDSEIYECVAEMSQLVLGTS